MQTSVKIVAILAILALIAIGTLLLFRRSHVPSYRVGTISPRLLDGLWIGRYTYQEKELREVAIAAVLKQNRDGITGRLIEPNTFGPTDAPSLDSRVSGSVRSDGRIELIFEYDGTGGVSHQIVNMLEWSDDGEALTGTWDAPDNPGWGGAIELRKVSDMHRD
jgi:hypothetical protein